VNVVLIEDEAKIASFVAKGLDAHGFHVLVARDGAGGLNLALDPSVDLVVLDLMLPDMTGTEVLARLRERRTDVPVIVLTARDAVADRVANLNAGADDYLTKPFSFSELLARIHARLRPRTQALASVLTHGRVTLDLHSRVVTLDYRSIEMSAKEFRLL